MFVPALLTLVMLGSALSAPFPTICQQNVILKSPKEIQVGCNLLLRFSIPAHILSTVGSLDVRLYPDNSHRGTLVHQVQTKDILSNQENVDIMFPVARKFLGSNTLTLTETSRNGIGCPTIFGAQELMVGPKRAGDICIF
ncbi:hypothetical protein K493DRAFT_312253 [Basidiobolus meristosporus CBS 931.73]|uniref:Uncharacterized protein n=1 Tax=Basidiobolus meristosporus CBS 931.73 TaxID=1314790 RepID=A0A1Y1YUZ4_9FUNG|nr:hypothetical protein K493DRAFT_312253 [Basidiobolus meristosporus CBS 931.73]|eukprot:ORY01860.1 hypothetical protein K493DRAFT_312253 [Basidiobolus meristosporus CBS 931.73]